MTAVGAFSGDIKAIVLNKFSNKFYKMYLASLSTCLILYAATWQINFFINV